MDLLFGRRWHRLLIIDGCHSKQVNCVLMEKNVKETETAQVLLSALSAL